MYTPEPWQTNGPIVEQADGAMVEIAECLGILASWEHEMDVAEANARRIVACVNACREIPTETLEVVAASNNSIETWGYNAGYHDAMEEQNG